MTAGRPKQGDAGTLYAFAHQFYSDLRRLVEGSYRRRLDQERYRRLLARAENVLLRDDQISHVHNCLEEEVRTGRVKKRDKTARLAELLESTLAATHEELKYRAGKLATIHLKIPGEPDVFDALLQAKSPEQVHSICEDAPNWPTSPGSVLPFYLSKYASEFIAAKNDPRFPRSKRPSSRLKQFWFLSRALAGAIHGYETRTAINLVGSIRPEEAFEKSRSAKPVRKRKKPGTKL